MQDTLEPAGRLPAGFAAVELAEKCHRLQPGHEVPRDKLVKTASLCTTSFISLCEGACTADV